jgi:PD-(D/E)XK nuclease superfamily
VDMEDTKDMLEAMAMNYEAYWQSQDAYPLPQGFDLIQAEQTCVVPVVGTPHNLEATLDGLMRHKQTGMVYVLERKTFERHPALEMLDMEFQFTAYMWVVSQLGFMPGGVAYDGAWKRKSPPKGRTIDDLFLRRPITHSQAWLDDFQESLVQIVQDMAEACYNPAKRYANKNTFTSGCAFCSVKPICDAMSNGEDVEAVRKQFYVPRDVGGRAAVWTQQGEA